MGEISPEVQAHFALLVQQWDELPPGEINFDLLPPELKAAWEERAPAIQSILKENGGPCTATEIMGFFVNDVFVPLAHGLDHNPSVTDE